MKIAIDASRAFLHERTGIEEYSYQLIKHLRGPLKEKKVTLFLRRGTKVNIDFDIPKNWRVKELWSPRFWTYIRLSWSLFFRRPEKLLVPGHIVPPIHPKSTTVVIHGLEFEIHPEAYSDYEIRSMRRGIKNSCKWSRNIVCVSNNTKKDLMRLYDVPKDKIRVVYEGVNPAMRENERITSETMAKYKITKQGYIIFIGRLEERKNISSILKSFEIIKRHFVLGHKLVLVGKGGYGWNRISEEIAEHPFAKDIIVTGFVGEEEKWSLLRHATVFMFPSLYEGFGLPVLEAQQIGVPVVTSNNSSLREVAKDSAVLVDPGNVSEIAQKINDLIVNEQLRQDVIARGFKNTERFTWNKCAKLVEKMMMRR